MQLNRAQRRRFDALPATTPIKQAMALTNAAHGIATERMVGTFGNKLSGAHNEALYRTAGLFSMIAVKQKTGRVVADMPTGAGKTLSVVSWLAAVHRLNMDIGVTVAAGQVEALAKMIRDLVEQGVPREKIGLIHAKGYCPLKAAAFQETGDYSILGDKFASEPVTEDNQNRPFLFVSHARIRKAADDAGKESIITDYRGRKRDLLIWDEVLLTTAPMAATMADVRSGIGAIRPYVVDEASEEVLALAMRYLSNCEKWIEDEWQRQTDGQPPSGLTLPALSEAEEEAFSAALRAKLGDEARSWPALKMLLTAAGQELRLARMGNSKSALISYRVTIPPALKDIVILDAGHVVSRLVGLDPTIKRDAWFQEQADKGVALKSYENVKVHFAKERSGRASMEQAFATRKANGFPSQLVKTITDIPKDEAAIVFTFKHKRRNRPDMPSIIRQELRKVGIDPEAKMEDGKPRISILTWGQHTSLNEYAHAQNILFAGVLHLEDEMLLAHAVGQSGDLLTPLDERFNVGDIKRGEIASTLYQAMSRGSCRFTLDGKAKPMKVWLVHYDDKIKAELEKVMPGLSWATWDIGDSREATKADATALRIAALLRDHTGDKVSNRAIKAELGLESMPATTFKRAVRTVSAAGWSRCPNPLSGKAAPPPTGFKLKPETGPSPFKELEPSWKGCGLVCLHLPRA